MKLSRRVWEGFRGFAALEPVVKKVAESIGNGTLDKRIKIAVGKALRAVRLERSKGK